MNHQVRNFIKESNFATWGCNYCEKDWIQNIRPLYCVLQEAIIVVIGLWQTPWKMESDQYSER